MSQRSQRHPDSSLNDFFVATFRAAGQINYVILLNVEDYGAYTKIVGHFAYAQVFFFDLGDELELVIVRATAAEEGVGRKYVVMTLHNVLVFHLVRLVNIRVNGHGAKAEEQKTVVTKVRNLNTLKGDNGFRRNIEGGGAITSDYKAHFVLGVINKG